MGHLSLIKAFRIDADVRSSEKEVFNGEGALFCGGRWNSKGNRMVYASSSLALAALEKLVHLQGAKTRIAHSFWTIYLSNDSIHTLADLSAETPFNTWETQALGDKWLTDKQSLALAVPSAIIPQEQNILINPALIPWNEIKIEGPFPFSFDSRLLKMRGL